MIAANRGLLTYPMQHAIQVIPFPLPLTHTPTSLSRSGSFTHSHSCSCAVSLTISLPFFQLALQVVVIPCMAVMMAGGSKAKAAKAA